MSSYAHVRLERPGWAESALPVVAGSLLLVARAETLSLGAERFAVLLIVYAALAVISLAPPAAGARPGLVSGWAVTLVGVATIALLAVAPWRVTIPSAARLSAIGLGVVAALAEEAFFRRLLYGWLDTHLGAAIAVAGSALAFALVHVPLYGASVLWVDLGAGVLLSWQRWASGSWGPPALTHSFANVVAGL